MCVVLYRLYRWKYIKYITLNGVAGNGTYTTSEARRREKLMYRWKWVSLARGLGSLGARSKNENQKRDVTVGRTISCCKLLIIRD
jgi:hypothetical protein